jgi:hypothetical protein
VSIPGAGDDDAAAGKRSGAGELELDGHFRPHGHFLLGLEFDSAFADAKGRGRKLVKGGGRLNGQRLKQVGFGFTGAHANELSIVSCAVNGRTGGIF